MARPTYNEGDCFAVPLCSGGYATGVLARTSRSGILLGYFFGPRRPSLPDLADLANLRADDAIDVHLFGHLGLVRPTQTNARWAIIGRVPGWNRDMWPMPVFGRYEELTGRWFEMHYSDRDLSAPRSQRQVAATQAERLPHDGMAGAGFMEECLDRML